MDESRVPTRRQIAAYEINGYRLMLVICMFNKRSNNQNKGPTRRMTVRMNLIFPQRSPWLRSYIYCTQDFSHLRLALHWARVSSSLWRALAMVNSSIVCQVPETTYPVASAMYGQLHSVAVMVNDAGSCNFGSGHGKSRSSGSTSWSIGFLVPCFQTNMPQAPSVPCHSLSSRCQPGQTISTIGLY